MRYVDIGTLPNKNTTSFRRGNLSSPKQKKKSGGRKLKTTLWLLFVGLFFFGLYSFLPPIKDSLASMLNGSSAVFSYLVTGSQELKKDGGKTNVLLMGIDKRSDESYTYRGVDGVISKNSFRSDTIIVASYNYESEKVAMLSIPRDLWVDVPAFGDVQRQSMKINGVYSLGDVYNYPGGGQALLTKVVSDLLGVPIHYSARVDFEGVVQAIDSVGGIDVEVENAFVDYMYPIEGMENAWPISSRYKMIQFESGLQHMDGETALEYARSRHAAGVEGTDFARAIRQQKVITGFKEKAFSTETMKSPQALVDLYQSLGDSFSTSAEINELLTAYDLAKTIDAGNIASYNLDDRDDHPGGLLYAPPVSQYGAYVLVPEDETYAEIRLFVQQIFSAEGLSTSPSVTPTLTPTGSYPVQSF